MLHLFYSQDENQGKKDVFDYFDLGEGKAVKALNDREVFSAYLEV